MEKKRTGRFEYKWEESRHQGTSHQDFAIDWKVLCPLVLMNTQENNASLRFEPKCSLNRFDNAEEAFLFFGFHVNRLREQLPFCSLSIFCKYFKLCLFWTL